MIQPMPNLLSTPEFISDGNLPTISTVEASTKGRARDVVFEDEILSGHGHDLCSEIRSLETRMRRRNDWYGGDR